MRLRATAWWSLSAVLVAAAVFVVMPRVLKYWPRHRARVFDELRAPVAVMGSTVAGLQLADGRLVKLPGVRSLPEYSTALYEVARRGVEIDAEGRVWGLVRVHHWCGNDPIGEHIARVDVARFLIYLDDAIQDSRIVERDIASTRGSFRSFGWNVSEYHGLMQRQQ